MYWNKFLYRHDIWAVWSHTFSWWEWKHTKVAFELELLEGCFVWILVPLNKLIPAHSPLPATLPLASHLAGLPHLCWLGSFDCFIWDEIRTVSLTSACLIQLGLIRKIREEGGVCPPGSFLLQVLHLETDRWEENLLRRRFSQNTSQKCLKIIWSHPSLLLPCSYHVNVCAIQLVSQVRKCLSSVFPHYLPTRLCSLLKYYSIYCNLLKAS